MSHYVTSNRCDLDFRAQWDIRTFNLLHTVPALDQCQLRFNKTGQIIYGGKLR